jgi:hypothetical protein
VPALPAALRIESLLVLLAWMAWALPYVSVDKCRSSNEWIEAIEVQRKIVYDTNKKPASDQNHRGQNAQVFGVPEAVLQRLERSAYLSGLQVHRRLA